ncbi:MAG: pilus assembly protein PilP [gamma proteobacterium symbiont of Bathyaustriella thionipta]|nr:pilus assembly protein PilP [gamma proteobacterium symbiont of Bathyaustriella thionipta]
MRVPVEKQHVLWLIFALPLILTGCGTTDMSDLKAYVGEVKSRRASRIAPLPDPGVVERFIYRPEGLRNPFVPSEALDRVKDTGKVDNGIQPEIHPPEELERFSLDSLRLVGTLEQNNTIWALIRAGDKSIHRVSKGNYLGKNNGKITSISEDKVELT